MAAVATTILSPTADPTYETAHRLLSLSGTVESTLQIDQVSWVNSAGGSGTGTYVNTGSPGSWVATFEILNIVLSSGENTITVTGRNLALETGDAELIATYTIPASRVGAVPKYKIRSKSEKKFL